jgi:hypothetical protein
VAGVADYQSIVGLVGLAMQAAGSPVTNLCCQRLSLQEERKPVVNAFIRAVNKLNSEPDNGDFDDSVKSFTDLKVDPTVFLRTLKLELVENPEAGDDLPLRLEHL